MESITASNWMIIIEAFLCTTIGIYLGWSQANLMRNSGKSFLISMFFGPLWAGVAWGVMQMEGLLQYNFWGRAGFCTLVSILFLSGLSYFTRTKVGNGREGVVADDKTDSQKAA